MKKTETTLFLDRTARSFSKYLNEISGNRPLSQEDERTLAIRIAGGDKRALDMLVSRNLLLVVKIAKNYQHRGISIEDLVAEGNMGLIEAAKRFSAEKEAKFSTYAAWWIMEAIEKALENYSSHMRISHGASVQSSKVREAERTLEQRLMRPVTEEEIAEELDMSVTRVHELLNARQRAFSIDSPIREEDGPSRSELMYVEDNLGSSTLAEETDNGKYLNEALDRLGSRGAYIIRHSYGIGCEEQTLREMAAELNLTAERVRQLRNEAVSSLGHSRFLYELRYCG